MPNELISSLNFGLELGKIEIGKGLSIMQSFVPNVERRAELKFTNIKGVVSNISSNPEIQTEQNPVSLIYQVNYRMRVI